MRKILFGVVLGAFGTVWAMGALPEPVESLLNDKLGDLTAKIGIGSDSGSSDGNEGPTPTPTPSTTPSTTTGAGGDFATADALRRGGVFEDGHLIEVYTCPGMQISNQPSANSDGQLKRFKPLIKVEGVTIAVAPVSHGCFSSGYGNRNGKLHKGIDFHSETVSQVYAAGNGTIVEAVYRDDYGNMVVVDHGNGVYTRYAHLKSFASGITEGKSVTGTTRLGAMGQSAGYRVVIHLHYELLFGDFDTPAKSFGLNPGDPMAY